MIITNATLENLRTMLCGEFKRRFAELDATPVWKTLGMLVPSTTQSNTYGWLGAFPQLRRWVGPRVIRDIAEFSYQIVNKLDEATLGVARVNIEDDNLGMYRAMAAAMADEYMRYMNRNIALLIENGFTDLCYDGQPSAGSQHRRHGRSDRRVQHRRQPGRGGQALGFGVPFGEPQTVYSPAAHAAGV